MLDSNMVESPYLAMMSECHNIIDQISDKCSILVVPIPKNGNPEKDHIGSQLEAAITGLRTHLLEVRDSIK